MNRFIIIPLATLILLFTISNAWADITFINFGAPVKMSFQREDESGKKWGTSKYPTGYMVHIQLPIFIGFGMDRFDQEIDDDTLEAQYGESKLRMTIYDLFFTLPIPLFKISVGGGLGNAELLADENIYEDAVIYQWFAQLGIPIEDFMDIHFSYHSIAGKLKPRTDYSATVSTMPIDSIVWGIGFSLGF